jgi:hypothetical protein
MAYQFKTRSVTPTEKRLTAAACAHLFAEQQALNTDPGIGHVQSGETYTFNGAALTGEYTPPPGGGSGGCTVIGSSVIASIRGRTS